MVIVSHLIDYFSMLQMDQSDYLVQQVLLKFFSSNTSHVLDRSPTTKLNLKSRVPHHSW